MDASELILLLIEGMLAFISPCFLPMIPVYISYLAGQGEQNQKTLITNALGFILGFTVVFVSLGLTATTLAKFLIAERLLLQRVGGGLLILFGLNMTGILKISWMNRDFRFHGPAARQTFFSSFLFGVIISFGWSPCLGAFLGAALIQAGNSATVWIGGFKLLIFSLGLGIPFLVTALLFNNLTGVFQGVRRHYETISLISGIFLIIMGILMVLDRFTFYANVFY
ncbi:cytochrome c biogenesis CcdA family protein [Clostridiaceae bacterium HFYG-1003]|nr:cytochrome c biogenesis CcdA family protein [Clostridiaceae bacterium HFYG-1003]